MHALKPRSPSACVTAWASIRGTGRLRAAGVVQLLHAAGNRAARAGHGDIGSGWPAPGGDAAWQCALRRREVHGGRGLPGNPDPLRPGTCRCAGPDHPPDRRRGGEEGARRRGHPLQLPRPQDRRAGACPGRRPRQRGEHPPVDRQSGQHPAGHAGCGGRRGCHHRPQRDPSRRPDPRCGGFGQPARHRPRRGHARSAADGGRTTAGRGCRPAHRWPGRGTGAGGEVADLRLRPGDLSGLPW